MVQQPPALSLLLGVDPDALLRDLPMGITIQEPSGRLVYANRAAADLLGFEAPEALIRAGPSEILERFEFRGGSGEPMPLERLPGRQVLAGVEPEELLVRVRLRDRPGERWRIATAFPLRNEGGDVAFAVNVFRDVTEQKLIERRLTAQYEVTRVLAEAPTLTEAAPRVLEAVCESLDWDVGNLWRVDEPMGVVRLVRSWHRGDGDLTRFVEACRDVTFPAGEGLPGFVWRACRPVWASDVQADPRAAIRAEAAAAAGLHAGLAFPVVRRDEVVGVVEFFSREVRGPDEELLRVTSAIGSQVGQFIDRNQAHGEQRFLVRASDVLASSLDYERTLGGLADLVVPRLADVCIVYIQDPDRSIRRVAIRESPAAVTKVGEQLQEEHPMDPDAELGIPKVLRTGEPEFHPSADVRLMAADVADPERLATLLEPLGVRSWMAVPLAARGRTFGAMSFISTASGRRFDADDLGLAQELARRAALHVDNARLFREAEEANEWLTYLADASRSLSTSLNYRRTLAKLAKLAVPRLADWCIVDMVEEDGSIALLAVAHADPERGRLARRLRRRYPPDPQAPTGTAHVIRTGRSEVYAEITDEMLAAAARDEEHLRLMRELSLRSAMIVPLAARGRVLGAITMVSAESGRRYEEEQLRYAEDLASRAATAVDNARLYEDRASVARTLQRSLLPPDLPVVPGVELAATYRPAAAGEQIGGDFYDVFQTGEREWAVVIGDVCGKGVQAASLTGLARHTIRATAMQDLRPGDTLGALNEVIKDDGADAGFCTVAYGRLRLLGRGAQLTVVCGGHPPPLAVRGDGDVEAVGSPGTLIGVLPEVEAHEETIRLDPGDAIVFYTDGVTDQRSGSSMFGEGRLRRLLKGHASVPPQELIERIEGALDEFADEPARDDMAIVALRLQPD
ncbi:MAG TPA: SpoIIE family protein phosphatase [Actinomycetota bacterium]|nr:SpoIIE family protein phosphatase [Actinomycetota bacterium]